MLLVKENIKSWITLEDKEVRLRVCDYICLLKKNKPKTDNVLVRCDVPVVYCIFTVMYVSPLSPAQP